LLLLAVVFSVVLLPAVVMVLLVAPLFLLFMLLEWMYWFNLFASGYFMLLLFALTVCWSFPFSVFEIYYVVNPPICLFCFIIICLLLLLLPSWA
jgi:hypothetical protein